ncbi:hypothetical protein ABLE68_10335 [Nocardioides sp. CN2-186]|uniref:hypothetical protein n=1 Tax=Nocardioides tweenelious TaxID=3156607 RepID=UPI0032B4FFA6
MVIAWAVLVVALIVLAWSVVSYRSVAVELAARPEQEYHVAGLDKSAEVGRHATWGVTPWRMRRLRRRLDEAAVKIAAFEAEERRRRNRQS